MKKWFVYIVYISIVFLIIALIRGHYLSIPIVYSVKDMVICIVLLFSGFIFDALAWWKTLTGSGIMNISFKSALAGHGLSILGKYIPGKFWIVIGRASYAAKESKRNGHELALISLTAQLISIWTSFLFGLIVFIFIPAGDYFIISVIALILWLFLFAILFTGFFHTITGKLFGFLLKKKITVPRISVATVIRIIPWYILTWSCWCISFYFLISAFLEVDISIFSGLSFALAATFGLVILIAPGGLGVREGILTGLLALWGLSAHDAATIAVTARIWFLIGEIFIFILGFIASGIIKRKAYLARNSSGIL